MLANKCYLNFYKYKRKLIAGTLKIARQLVDRGVATQANQQRRLSILFFGTDNFSLPSLKELHKSTVQGSRTAKLGVVTSFKNPANCVRVYAEREKLSLYGWPITIDECRHYDLGVVVSFGHLIPEKLINAFPLGMINVHASLLPRWRGAAPIIYAIMHGDHTTGVSIMKIEPKHFDVGDIFAQRQVPIREDILMPELHGTLAQEGAQLLLDVVSNFPARAQTATKQNNADATFAPKITAAVAEIAWSEYTATTVFNRYRALYSFKHLTTRFHDKVVQFIDVRLPKGVPHLQLSQPGAFVFNKNEKCLLVQCAKNTHVEVHQLRLEGKKVMSAVDFNNGFLRKHKVAEFLFSRNKNV